MAPTARSQLCPGCPCAGLSLGMALLFTVLLLLGKSVVYAGADTGANRGREAGIVSFVSGTVSSFSPQEVKYVKQKKKAV